MVVWGAVQPEGTATVSAEPEPNGPVEGAVNVKVRVLPDEPATAVVGDTIMAPLPLAAEAAATISVPVPVTLEFGLLRVVHVLLP